MQNSSSRKTFIRKKYKQTGKMYKMYVYFVSCIFSNKSYCKNMKICESFNVKQLGRYVENI